jgi:RNA polymerase sigma factor (sigma-70 family)
VAAVPSIGRASRVDRPDVQGAAAAGDLYERYSSQIFGYCLHQLGSREEAEDAVQTTFMNAFRGLQRGIVPELESAWLFKIAHNVCLSRRRSSWRRGRVEAPNNFEVLSEVVPGREQSSDELIRLQDALEEMPENQRRAILLREWQGLTYHEISDELGLSQAAVETLIFRARRALAQGLEQDADTWKKRLRRGADVGGVIACAKTLLGGGGAAAIKLGATAAVVAGAAVAAATAPVVPKQHQAAAAPGRVTKAPKQTAVRRFAPAVSRVSYRAPRPRPVVRKALFVRTAPAARAPVRRTVHTPPPASPNVAASTGPTVATAPAVAANLQPEATLETSAAAPQPPAVDPAPAPELEQHATTATPPADEPAPPSTAHGIPDAADKSDSGHGKDHK